MTKITETQQAEIEKQERKLQERLYQNGTHTFRIFPRFSA